MADKIDNRMRYTRQSIISNTFLQMPHFLFTAEFCDMSSHAKVLYTLMLDRHRQSIKNNWFDENGEAYIYYKRETMQLKLNLSDKPTLKVLQELKKYALIEEKKQGLNKPNKIYLLAPILGKDVEYSFDDADDDCENDGSDISDLRNGYSPTLDTDNLRFQTRNNSALGHGETTIQDTANFRPINNKLTNNKNINNHISNNKGSKTATVRAAVENPPPDEVYAEILVYYNALCDKYGLRPITAIDGDRKTAVDARLTQYGFNGFVLLFEKVEQSHFLCGGGERGWKADFDWLIQPNNMQKVLEGKYDNDQSNTPGIAIITQSNNSSRGGGFNTMDVLSDILAECEGGVTRERK